MKGGIGMNKRAYKSKMALFGDTNASIAHDMGISPQRNSAKLNGTNGAEYTCGEIIFHKKRWNLSPEEVDFIFFTDDVS